MSYSNPEEYPLGVDVGVSELASGTDGQLITWDSSGDPAAIGPGSAGQLLVSAGSGASPSFDDTISIDTSNGRVGIGDSTPLTSLVTNGILSVELGNLTVSKYLSDGSTRISSAQNKAHLLFNGGAADKPEINWYRGTRTYPEFCIKQHTTPDTGGEVLTGDGEGTPAKVIEYKKNGIIVNKNLSATPDEITATSAGVAASVNTLNTEVTTNGDQDLDNVTLANGVSGQVKHIYCVVEGNANDTWKITPANMIGGTQITFSGVGEGCTLVYADSEGWVVVGNNGGTIS